jgi:drug/metabolite transporter (DMT)-like permease
LPKHSPRLKTKEAPADERTSTVGSVSETRKVHAALLLATVAIGAGFVCTKVILQDVPPLAWVCMRVMVTGIVLLALFGRHLRQAALGWRDHATMALCGLFGVVANQGLFAVGLRHTTPAHGSLIGGLVPLMTAVMAGVAARRALSVRQWAGFALTMPGLAYLLGCDQLGWAASQLTGDLIMLGSASCYALYLVISRPLFQRHGWQVAIPGMFAWAIPGMALLGLPTAATADWGGLTLSHWGLVAFMILGPSVGAYVAFAWALQRAESSQVALYGYLQPVIAMGLAAAFLGDTVTPRLVISTVVIVAGLVIALGKPLNGVAGRIVPWGRMRRPVAAAFGQAA